MRFRFIMRISRNGGFPEPMLRILVVDDEGSIRKLLSIAFLRAGHEVRTAANAREALALCAAESFDVLLSDVLMPQVNGHELVRWVTMSDRKRNRLTSIHANISYTVFY